MKTPKYSDEDIIAAGKQLISNKQNVNPFAIRKITGGGNPERIKKVWAAYEETGSKEKEPVKSVELPSDFESVMNDTKDNLDDLAKSLYNHALDVCERRVRDSLEEANKKKANADIAVADATDEVNRADRKVEELKALLEERGNELKLLEQANARVSERLETLSIERDNNKKTISAERTLVRDLQKQVATLEVRTEVAEKNATVFKSESESTANELLIAVKQTKELDQTITRLNTRCTLIEKEKKVAESNLSAANASAETLKEKVGSLNERLQETTTDLAIATSQLADSKEKHSMQSKDYELLQKEVEQVRSHASELKGKLAVYEELKNQSI